MSAWVFNGNRSGELSLERLGHEYSLSKMGSQLEDVGTTNRCQLHGVWNSSWRLAGKLIMEISSSEQTTGPLGVWDSAAPRLEHSDGHSFPSAQPRAGEIYQRVICRMRHATKTRAGCQRNGSASAWCHFERGKDFHMRWSYCRFYHIFI
jgi:hypothetical protein